MSFRWNCGAHLRCAALVLVWMFAGATLGDANQLGIRVETTNMAGETVTAVNEGDPFQVRVYVRDLRELAEGVFATYMDLTYETNHVEVDGAIAYEPPYQNGRRGSLSTPGLVDEVGAFGGLSSLDSGERLLYTVPFMANSVGNAIFETNPADSAFGKDVLLYGFDDQVLPGQINYGAAMLPIYPALCDLAAIQGPVGDVNGDFAVNFPDFLVLSSNFGLSTPHGIAGGDLDCDGAVLFSDFLIMSESFGDSLAAASSVPEPQLLGAGLLSLALWRRRRR